MMYRRLLISLLVLLPSLLDAQALPPKLKTALQNELHAKDDDIRTLEQGGVIAYLVDQEDGDHIMLVGATRIRVTPEKFLDAYRDIVKFESSPDILASGKFSNPPKEEDFKGFALGKDEIDDILNCKPGDCDFKLSDRALKELRTEINRSSPNYVDQTNNLLRKLWLDYIRRYQAQGDRALIVYHDTPKYSSVQEGMDELIRHSNLHEYAPELVKYLSSYPSSKQPGIEEFIYWQVAEFGLKPVHRATHVVIAPAPARMGKAYVIASKMLFASHYFRSALELRFLIPGDNKQKGGMHYLITVQRSYVDGLTGLKGRLIRPVVLSKSRSSMESYMRTVKERLEAGKR